MVVKGMPFLICSCKRPLLVGHQLSTNDFRFRWHTTPDWKPDRSAVRGQCKSCRCQFRVSFVPAVVEVLCFNLDFVEPEKVWIAIEEGLLDLYTREVSSNSYDRETYARCHNCHIARYDDHGIRERFRWDEVKQIREERARR